MRFPSTRGFLTPPRNYVRPRRQPVRKMCPMNVFSVFTAHVQSAVKALAAAGVFANPPDLSRIVVEPPREASHGDLATNAAMVLAKDAGLKPRDLAERLATELGQSA